MKQRWMAGCVACMNENAEGAEGEKNRLPSYDESRMSESNSPFVQNREMFLVFTECDRME